MSEHNSPQSEKPKRFTKCKTFQKGEQFYELIEWVGENVSVIDWQPEGTDWSGGEPGPIDPRCDLDAKYIVTITRIAQ